MPISKIGEAILRSYSNWMIFLMDLGMKGDLSFALRAGLWDSASFLIWLVVLMIKEKARLRRRVIAAI
jgi:hypothetical protein